MGGGGGGLRGPLQDTQATPLQTAATLHHQPLRSTAALDVAVQEPANMEETNAHVKVGETGDISLHL